MNGSQDSAYWSQGFNQKQTLQEYTCGSTKRASDWIHETGQSKQNSLFGKYKCTVCNNAILDCKCKPSIFDDDDSSCSSEPKQCFSKCSICNEKSQSCKCNKDSTFPCWKNKLTLKPTYPCLNNPIEDCVCKRADCDSDNSGEDLDNVCESNQANLHECFGKWSTCTQDFNSNNYTEMLVRKQKTPLNKCTVLQDCTCKPSENTLKMDEFDCNDSPQPPSKCLNCNKTIQECTCKSKQFHPKCAGCTRSPQSCICKTQKYKSNILNNKRTCSASATTKHKCKTCRQPVQDCTCRTYSNTPVLPKSNMTRCTSCKKTPQDCICKPSIHKDYQKASSYPTPAYAKYKCNNCNESISDCTCDPDFSKRSSVTIRCSVGKCMSCNKPLDECTCKPNINENNSWESSYSNTSQIPAKCKCTTCYQPVQDCTCNSSHPAQDGTGKKSQFSSVKCLRSFNRSNPPRTKPKHKCLRCKKPIQECRCTSTGVESNSSNDMVNCRYKSTIPNCELLTVNKRQRLDCPCSKIDVGPKCLCCGSPPKDCKCKNNSPSESSNCSFTKTKSCPKPAFTKYKCANCNMPLLECKCSPSDTPSIVLDRIDENSTPCQPKPSCSKYKPSTYEEEESEIIDFSSELTHACLNCTKPIQECRCKISKIYNKYSSPGFSGLNGCTKPQLPYKCSECHKPLQQCKCKSGNAESLSDLECINCSEPIRQCECKPERYEVNNCFSAKPKPVYICCICKRPIDDCQCKFDVSSNICSWDNSTNDQKFTCSDCRMPIQNCKCKQDVEDDLTVAYYPAPTNPVLPNMKYISCDNPPTNCDRLQIRSNLEQENYSTMYPKTRSRTKYVICGKCNKSMNECICKESDYLINQTNECKRLSTCKQPEQKDISSIYFECATSSNKTNQHMFHPGYIIPECETFKVEPSCELLKEYSFKMANVGKTISNRRYNIPVEERSKLCNQDKVEDNRKQEGRCSEEAPYQLNKKSSCLNPKQSKQCMKRGAYKSFGKSSCKNTSAKKKSTKSCKLKDYPQFPHPSLITEACSESCDPRGDPDCPLTKECSSINLKSSKYRSTNPTRKIFEMHCNSRIQPSSSFKDDFTGCPPLFLKVFPVPKVGSKYSASRIRKFPSKVRNCMASSRKSFKDKNVRHRSPLNCSSGMRDNKCPFREKHSNRLMCQRKSCKRCNQPIPEDQSVDSTVGYSSVTNEFKNYNPQYQNNKNCKFN